MSIRNFVKLKEFSVSDELKSGRKSKDFLPHSPRVSVSVCHVALDKFYFAFRYGFLNGNFYTERNICPAANDCRNNNRNAYHTLFSDTFVCGISFGSLFYFNQPIRIGLHKLCAEAVFYVKYKLIGLGICIIMRLPVIITPYRLLNGLPCSAFVFL